MLTASPQDFLKLIKVNECSLATRFAIKFLPCPLFLPRCKTCDFPPKVELLSRCDPVKLSKFLSYPVCLRPRTFPWLLEVYRRFRITNELVTKCFQEIMHSIYEIFPELENDGQCKRCLTARVAVYLRVSIQVLFRIFDGREDDAKYGRATQEYVIENASDIELAVVNLLLFTTSLYHCYYSSYQKRPVWVQREMQSVFRELALRHGPQLIWASLMGDDMNKRMVGEFIEKGLVELREYETSSGRVESDLIVSRSLQSVLMREFCRRANCELAGGWDAIFGSLKHAVLFPEPNKPHVH